MADELEDEIVDIGEAEDWTEYAIAQGWSDGLPLVPPTEAAVDRFTGLVRGDNEPFAPISPRQLVPTVRSLAANAVMAGCRPEYFPAVLAGLRAVLDPAYNLHGTLATTHPCAPMLLVNGPIRQALDINCASNCFGQGWRANATIGRALELILLNVGGAKPALMDRSTQGSPAKYSYCFGENEEASPWAPYHVRRGFAASDSVVTAMSAEGPHNINDHASTTGVGILTTVANTMSEAGSNNVYVKGPLFVAFGPEHAATLKRDGFEVADIQEELFKRARIHISRVSPENREHYEDRGAPPIEDHFAVGRSPESIHIIVAGGPGKHSAFIPSFGSTEATSARVKPG
jgi:hypothetical protein